MSVSRIQKMNIEAWVKSAGIHTRKADKRKKRGYTFGSNYYFIKKGEKDTATEA